VKNSTYSVRALCIFKVFRAKIIRKINKLIEFGCLNTGRQVSIHRLKRTQTQDKEARFTGFEAPRLGK
jgi:hypothetical protein